MHVGILGTPWIGSLTLLCAVLGAGCSCSFNRDDCNKNSDCPINSECVPQLFFGGAECIPIKCTTQSDCVGGQACLESKCGPCTSGLDCDVGDACIDSKCGPCAADKECSSGEICNGSTCQPGCRTDSDCGLENVCENSVCVRGCRDDSRCRPGTVCQNSVCVRPCSADSDCAPGWVCDNLVCVEECRSNADCALQTFCKSGLCMLGCRSASECGPDNACKDGTCVAVVDGCSGACCPSDNACYSDPANGKLSPGAECLATRDNAGLSHIQMRQQWVRPLAPAGLTIPLVYLILSGGTQLPWKSCNQAGILGSGGHIQLVDFFLEGSDISKHYSTAGYAQYVPGPAMSMDPTTFVPTDVLQNGFCYGTETFAGGPATNKIEYGLRGAEVGDGAGFPPGLPLPMAVKDKPWDVKPTKAKRIDHDFDLASGTTRRDLLAMFDANSPSNIVKDGFNGIFYFDSATGTAHGFSPLIWTIVYDSSDEGHISIPIREAETRSKFNDVNHPDCVGTYLADAIDPATCQAGQDPTSPAWGGGDCTASTGKGACAPGEAPASTTGYFLISEVEQMYWPDLQATLCVLLPGNDSSTSKPVVDAEGFYDSVASRCKTSKWNPSDPVSGLPNGDWCAATNSAATSNCHDAWRTKWFQVFAGAKIKLDANDTPSTCPF